MPRRWSNSDFNLKASSALFRKKSISFPDKQLVDKRQELIVLNNTRRKNVAFKKLLELLVLKRLASMLL